MDDTRATGPIVDNTQDVRNPGKRSIDRGMAWPERPCRESAVRTDSRQVQTGTYDRPGLYAAVLEADSKARQRGRTGAGGLAARGAQ